MADNPHVLGDRGKALEDEFFRKEDDKLVQRLREIQQKTSTREALAQASGIKDEAVLDRLAALGVRPEIVSALATIPLVQVAWADGSISAKEKEAILEWAGKSGIVPGSPDYAVLASWLEHKPASALLAAWTEMIHGLKEQMSAAQIETLRSGVLERARAVASASGGFFSLRAISAAEEDMIAQLDAAFRT